MSIIDAYHYPSVRCYTGVYDWGLLFKYRFEAVYGTELPESIAGKDFLEKYLGHDDTVTIIDENRSYAVKAPTRHPIYENFRVKVEKLLFPLSLYPVSTFISVKMATSLRLTCLDSKI